jgi:hypothetical protein
MIKASAQKTLPMLIPALAAVLRPVESGDVGACGAGISVTVGLGVIAGEVFVDNSGVRKEAAEAMDEAGDNKEEAEDDEGVSRAIANETAVDDENATAAGLETPSRKRVAERPHVYGGKALFNVIVKNGELAPSSPDRFSSSIWQTPLFQYWG